MSDPEKGISTPVLDGGVERSGLKENPKQRGHRYRRPRQALAEYTTLALALLAFLVLVRKSDFPWPIPSPSPPSTSVPDFVRDGMKQCEIIQRPNPHHEPFDHERTVSDRFVPGTIDVLLRNATVWTGNQGGEEVLYNAEVYMSGGVVKHIGTNGSLEDMLKGKKEVEEVDLKGAWVTPGIVDMHSHMGVDASPALRGADDTNSLKSAILPWLRSLDGFNTHDLAFNNSIAGGITTMMILPGSAGNIGGQAFTVSSIPRI